MRPKTYSNQHEIFLTNWLKSYLFLILFVWPWINLSSSSEYFGIIKTYIYTFTHHKEASSSIRPCTVGGCVYSWMMFYATTFHPGVAPFVDWYSEWLDCLFNIMVDRSGRAFSLVLHLKIKSSCLYMGKIIVWVLLLNPVNLCILLFELT